MSDGDSSNGPIPLFPTTTPINGIYSHSGLSNPLSFSTAFYALCVICALNNALEFDNLIGLMRYERLNIFAGAYWVRVLF